MKRLERFILAVHVNREPRHGSKLAVHVNREPWHGSKLAVHVNREPWHGSNGSNGSSTVHGSRFMHKVACNADGVADGTGHQSCVTSVSGEGEVIEVLRSKLVTGVIDKDEFAHMRSVMLRAEAETLA